MARDRALAMQHELGRAGRARGREDVAGGAGQRMVGGVSRPRQQALERHAPQPLDGRWHRRGFVADDDDRREPVERRRIDVGQDRQEVDAAKARARRPAPWRPSGRRCRPLRPRDSACSRRRRWRPDARRRNREWDRPARWAATAPPVARPDAEIGEALRRASRAVEQFGKAQSPLAVDERRRIGRLLGDVGEQGPDVGGGMDKRHAARRLPQAGFISSHVAMLDPARRLLDSTQLICLSPLAGRG